MKEFTKSEEIVAIQNSIEHWKKIKNFVPGEEPSSLQCALCQLTNTNCEICPIYKISKRHHCQNTPYAKAYRAFFKYHVLHSIKESTFRKNIAPQIKFLKDLLKTELDSLP